MGPTPMLPARRAFTLIEILVVLTIIILIALSAMPAMRFIMGSRSIEGTQNIAAAMIGRARSQALADGEQRGVFFFVDPVSDRTTMALVGLGGGDLDQYHGWVMPNPPGTPAIPQPPIDRPGNSPTGIIYYRNGVPNETQSRIITITNSLYPANTPGDYLGMPRCIVRDYICVSPSGSNTPSTGNRPTTIAGNSDWATSGIDLQFVDGTDFQLLPQGVGVQLINGNPGGITNFDRYLRIGCIMFDRYGRFESVPWKIGAGTPLGSAMHLNVDLDLTTTNAAGQTIQPLFSQFGLVLYDRQTFLAQTTTPGNNMTEGDWIFSPGGSGKNFFQIPPAFPASFSDEMAQNPPGQPPSEEQWLDANSMPLLINRYDGTIIKGE
jgi:prepilin-type N-terminal cleavage/methylation domain-containing protein